MTQLVETGPKLIMRSWPPGLPLGRVRRGDDCSTILFPLSLGVPRSYSPISLAPCLTSIDGLDGSAAVLGFCTRHAFAVACVEGIVGLCACHRAVARISTWLLTLQLQSSISISGRQRQPYGRVFTGCFSVIWCQKSATVLGMAAPLISLLVPLTDVGVSIARRFVSNRPIFAGDGRHIHHRLLARGFHPRTVTLLLYTACGGAAVLSLLDSLLSQTVGGVVVVIVCVLAWMGIHFLGYDEFAVARRLAGAHGFRRAVGEELCLRKFQSRIAGAATLEECWPIIRDLCYEMKFHSVGLFSPSQDFGDSRPPATTSVTEALAVWRLEVAINSEIRLVLHRTSDRGDMLPGMGFLKTVQQALQSKFPEVPEIPTVAPEFPKPAAVFVSS